MTSCEKSKLSRSWKPNKGTQNGKKRNNSFCVSLSLSNIFKRIAFYKLINLSTPIVQQRLSEVRKHELATEGNNLTTQPPIRKSQQKEVFKRYLLLLCFCRYNPYFLKVITYSFFRNEKLRLPRIELPKQFIFPCVSIQY